MMVRLLPSAAGSSRFFGWLRQRPYAVATTTILLLVPPGFPLFELFQHRFPLQYFLLGVAFAAWNGGLGPGLLATGLGVLAGQLLFLPGRGQGLPTDAFDAARILIYLAIGLTISVFSEISRRRGERLQEALTAKQQFVANMSHELRTPLNSVLGNAELLQRYDAEPEERQEIIEAIVRNSQSLRRLTEDVLDLAKVDAGRLQIVVSGVSPRDLLAEVVQLFKAQAAEKGLALKLDVNPSVPAEVQTDPERLRQILINLVGNAVKFTDRGQVAVMTAPAETGRYLEIRIADTGIGIAADVQARLFQPFYQADMSTTRRFGGTGLGLALSRHLARALGGDIKIEHSALGAGSVFVVSVPVRDREGRS
jgi:signal transduction histidine kinase